MEVKLVCVKPEEAEKLWEMQAAAFQDLYRKYMDTDTSPATESLDKMASRLRQPFSYYYFITAGGTAVGAIRVIDRKDDGVPKLISPLFILKEYRGRGLAQQAMRLAEDIHGSSNWELDTILQEPGNCHLYEKMGYRRTDKTEVVNDRLTLVTYKKD